MIPAVLTHAEALPDRDELADVLRDYMSVADRLRQTHEALQHEVRRLRGELESKDRELERRRRLAALGELAAGVAHEVRNPLGAIQLYSGLLRREARESASAIGVLDKMDAAIRAIDSVVQDTLSLAPRGGPFTRVGVAELIERAADVCARVLESRGVALHVAPGDARVAVHGDAAALQRVLVNLIANAADASPRGAAVRIECGAGDGATLHVIDEGMGLSPELLDRVFDPFFTTKATGTGLGLAIAHRIVEAHGGRLTAENRSGERGAIFTVFLPLADDEGPPAAWVTRNDAASAATTAHEEQPWRSYA